MDEFSDIMSYAAVEKSSKNLSFENLRSCLCLENFKYEEFLFFYSFSICSLFANAWSRIEGS